MQGTVADVLNTIYEENQKFVTIEEAVLVDANGGAIWVKLIYRTLSSSSLPGTELSLPFASAPAGSGTKYRRSCTGTAGLGLGSEFGFG